MLIATSILNNFSLTDVVVVFVGGTLLIKEFVSIYDWAKSKFNAKYKDELTLEQRMTKIEESLRKIEERDQSKEIEALKQNIDLLIKSDKDDIKAFITKEYHYFVEQKGWIDKFSLDCIEKRYEIYKDEGGNSFIAELMAEIESLPKQPPQK